MQSRFRALIVVASIAAFAACSPEDREPADGNQPSDPGTPVAVVEDPGVTNPDGYIVENPDAAPSGLGAIPAAMRGRWGLVPADCEPGRADAKGLVEVDGTTLTFYESVGTLDRIVSQGARSIRGDFDFSGEGQTWEREILFELGSDGQRLTRTDFGDEAFTGPLEYSRCN